MNKEYLQLIQSLKQHVRFSQQQAVLTVNTRMLFLYWEIGLFINHQKEKLGWGASVIKQISKDLSSEFPEIKGFSERNLKYMARFADIQQFTKVQPLAAQIESKENEAEKADKKEKVQPLAAQIQTAVHWTDFINSPIAKVTWSHHMVLMDNNWLSDNFPI